MTAEDVLRALCETIEWTGGVVETRDGFEPAGDREWTDLGRVYLDACRILGREAAVTRDEDEDEDEDEAE